MHDFGACAAPMEVKFASDATTGEFEGYGAVYGSQDTHGDLLLPGAFKSALSVRSAEGRSLPMYAQHGPYVGGDHLPVGVWRSVEEDDRGLKVAGKISGMDTERGRTVHSLVRDGALRGLSIEFSVPRGGATYGKAAGEPKRTIKTANLFGISLVSDPAHPAAGVASLKAAMMAGERDKATASVAAAMRMHDKTMGSNYSDLSPKDKALLMEHLRDAHEALTGERAPDGLEGWTKSASLKSAMEEFHAASAAFSNSQR